MGDCNSVLLPYSIGITVLCILLSALLIYNRCCSRTRNYSNIKDSSHKQKRISRTNTISNHEIDSSPLDGQSRHQVKTTSPINRRDNEYHPTTFVVNSDVENPSVAHHQYEEIKNSKNESQYETILENVVTTLSTVYDDSSKSEDIYQRFFAQLLKKVSMKNTSTCGASSHVYAEVREHKRPVKNIASHHSSQSDHSYATFVSSRKEEKRVDTNEAESFSDNEKTIVGSTNHRKFLNASRRVNPDSDNPYLEAKCFSANFDCPEDLRRLCNEQVPNDNKISLRSPTNQVEVIEEYFPSRGTEVEQSTSSRRRVHSISNHRRSIEFNRKAKKIEKVLNNIIQQGSSVKLSKKKLNRSETLL